MGQNTTHLEPPEEVIAAIADSVARREFQLYAPAAGLEALRAEIVDDLGLSADVGVQQPTGFDCWITEGAVAGLHQVVARLATQIDQIIVSDPGWPWPGRFAGERGVSVCTIPVYERPRCLMTADDLAPVITDRSAIYLIDPLNPLGTSYTADELVAITDLARRHGAFVIHDATYRHFADRHTLAAMLYPERTFTTYSFSKWLGLAGFRLGAIVAASELLGTITAVPANPLGSNIVGQRAALAGLQVKAGWLTRLRGVTRTNLDQIEQAVATSRGRVVVARSQGNFLAIDLAGTGWEAEELCDAMLGRDIFIRPGTYQSPLFGDRFVKVSASVPADWTNRFIAAWHDLIGRPS